MILGDGLESTGVRGLEVVLGSCGSAGARGPAGSQGSVENLRKP